ncbi:MAG: DUF2442 domain-containing protein [Victivallales bacterium]|jgi:hypothetical protein|nr:DUF2442 domain-containing protein [Victivallales bacterium]
MLHKIKQLKPIKNFLLFVVFQDGAETLYDMSKLFDVIPAFRDFETIPEFFEQAKIDGGGYGVSWNDQLDIDAEELYTNGTRLKPALTLQSGCSCPTCGQMIRQRSEKQRAASLANLAKRKSKGGRPVNPNSKRQKQLRVSLKTGLR